MRLLPGEPTTVVDRVSDDLAFRGKAGGSYIDQMFTIDTTGDEMGMSGYSRVSHNDIKTDFGNLLHDLNF